MFSLTEGLKVIAWPSKWTYSNSRTTWEVRHHGNRDQVCLRLFLAPCVVSSLLLWWAGHVGYSCSAFDSSFVFFVVVVVVALVASAAAAGCSCHRWCCVPLSSWRLSVYVSVCVCVLLLLLLLLPLFLPLTPLLPLLLLLLALLQFRLEVKNVNFSFPSCCSVRVDSRPQSWMQRKAHPIPPPRGNGLEREAVQTAWKAKARCTTAYISPSFALNREWHIQSLRCTRKHSFRNLVFETSVFT